MKEMFFDGLPNVLKIKFAAEGPENVDSIITQVQKSETQIMNTLTNKIQTTIEFSNTPHHMQNQNQINKTTQKWCKNHKSTTHDTSECKFPPKPSTQHEKKLNSIGPTICERQGIINDRKILIQFDTGSTLSFINKNTSVFLENPPYSIVPIDISLASGDKQRITHAQLIVLDSLHFTMPKTTEVFVLDKCNYDLILGVGFMIDNEMLIDFQNNNLSFGETKIKQDDQIMVSNSVKTVKDLNNDEINKIVSQYTNFSQTFDPLISEKYKISLTNDNPISLPSYFIQIEYRKELRKHIDDLEKKQIIRKSHSMYASPCFVKRKSNGELRLKNDYRALNQISHTSEYFFLNITDTFHKIKGANVFSKLDLEKGF
ncbi:transposable element [Pseudoloma neurophilia]|uniref:Transposable element n=1 Tax=Pseudoloma neurophilia TaxID=146866 RepID=A0A0R0M3D6_9MICR|nr:transposable element [Pseudoloma neurophilia]